MHFFCKSVILNIVPYDWRTGVFRRDRSISESTHREYGRVRIADRLGDHFFGCSGGLLVVKKAATENCAALKFGFAKLHSAQDGFSCKKNHIRMEEKRCRNFH